MRIAYPDAFEAYSTYFSDTSFINAQNLYLNKGFKMRCRAYPKNVVKCVMYVMAIIFVHATLDGTWTYIENGVPQSYMETESVENVAFLSETGHSEHIEITGKFEKFFLWHTHSLYILRKTHVCVYIVTRHCCSNKILLLKIVCMLQGSYDIRVPIDTLEQLCLP